MGFHVDYSGLDQLYSGLYCNASVWNGSIATLSDNIKTLVSSPNMAGTGADNVKKYFDSVHNTIIPVLNSLLTAHVNNCLLYVRNYQSGIDNSLHAVIDEGELRQIKRSLAIQEDSAETINTVVQNTLRSVSDIIVVSCTGFPKIADNNSEIQGLIERLLTDVCELEDNHYQNDFIDTSQLISSLQIFISEYLANPRSYKADFSVESFAQSGSFVALAQSYVAVNSQIEANKDAVVQAITDENDRIDALNAEIEARQKQTEAEKWAVTGLCIVGSIVAIAVIVGTGGTATPLVVGTVSAVSGAVIAGNNAAADEYVKHGWDTSKWNAGNIGTSAVLGGVSGFITGYVGAGMSQAANGLLSSTHLGSTLLNSSSTVVRMGTGAVIGSTSEVISGVGTRGLSTFAVTMVGTGGDIADSITAARSSAFDLKSIAIDAATGGFSGAVTAKTQPVGREIAMDDLDGIAEGKPYHSPDPQKWLNNGGEIYVDANGTWTYVSADGVNVCYTDGYPDFKRAGFVEATYEVSDGFDTSNHSVDINKAVRETGKGGTGSGMTWHHSTDGKTLQLVETEIHEQFRHIGGFAIAKGG